MMLKTPCIAATARYEDATAFLPIAVNENAARAIMQPSYKECLESSPMAVRSARIITSNPPHLSSSFALPAWVEAVHAINLTARPDKSVTNSDSCSTICIRVSYMGYLNCSKVSEQLLYRTI